MMLIYCIKCFNFVESKEMKPRLEKIINPTHHSFHVRIFDEKHFTSPWHFHPEIEIILISSGYGTRFVEDSVKNFYPGDLCIIGRNTPHVFLSDQAFYAPESLLSCEAICIQFKDEFWGTDFNGLPEMKEIWELLTLSSRGIRYINKTRNQLEKMILEFPGKEGVTRITHLLVILETMSAGKDTVVLSSSGYRNIKLNLEDAGRMEKLYEFVFRNFNRKITVKEVSEVMSISPNSFCKYFKSRTNKVFSDFVSEVRIGNACKLLIENDLSITQICYESGFNNISNFYRQFKHIKQLTPSEFQKKYLKTAYSEPNYLQY